MKRSVIVLGVLCVFVLVYGWNALFLAPPARQRSEVRTQLAAAMAEQKTLRAHLAELRRLAANTTSREEELGRLTRLVPAEPDLAGFILAMNDVANRAKVDWASLSPGAPVAGAAGAPTTVALDIKVEGTFFQVVDYLKRIESLDHLVVIDAVDLATVAAAEGAPKLAATLRGRTFAASPGAGAG